MKVVLLSIGLFFVVFSCQKSAPDTHSLPHISQTGNHTLGFFINNEVWLPYDRGKYEDFELPQPSLDRQGHLQISSTRIDEKNSARNWFCIEVDSGCFRPGIYPISSKTCKSPYQTYYYGINKDKVQEIYQIDTLKPHYIEVHYLDSVQQIISGVFAFDAFSENEDTIKVRSGRFDLRYTD